MSRLRERVEAFVRGPLGRRVVGGLRFLFIAGVVSWLVYQLSGIGWAAVWAERPRTPWFYVIWIALYAQLPLVEAGIYRWLWDLPAWKGLWPILRKRALNQDVLSYSGEAFFFVWAREHVARPAREIAGTLKDNAIASSVATWASALLLIGSFLAAGQIVLTDLIGDQDPLYVGLAALAAVVIGVLGLRFRRALFTQSPRTVAALVGVHFVRFMAVVYVLQILQWWVVLPEAPMSVWATMLAVTTLVNRVPLIPAKDLVGIGAVLGMTDLLAASAAAIAAMLLVRSALDKTLNFLLFVGVTLAERNRASAAEKTAEGRPNPAGGSSSEEASVVSAEAGVH